MVSVDQVVVFCVVARMWRQVRRLGCPQLPLGGLPPAATLEIPVASPAFAPASPLWHEPQLWWLQVRQSLRQVRRALLVQYRAPPKHTSVAEMWDKSPL